MTDKMGFITDRLKFTLKSPWTFAAAVVDVSLFKKNHR